MDHTELCKRLEAIRGWLLPTHNAIIRTAVDEVQNLINDLNDEQQQQAEAKDPGHGFESDEAFLRWCKAEADDGNINLSSGEVILLLEQIERLRGSLIVVPKEEE